MRNWRRGLGDEQNCGPGGTPLEAPDRPDADVAVTDRPSYNPLVRDFDTLNNVTLAATMLNSFADVVRFDCPQGYQGYVQWWGQDVTSPGTFQDVTWRITVNDEVRLVYPPIAQVSTLISGGLTRLHIWISPMQWCAVQASNSNAATRAVAARLKGLVFPERYQRS